MTRGFRPEGVTIALYRRVGACTSEVEITQLNMLFSDCLEVLSFLSRFCEISPCFRSCAAREHEQYSKRRNNATFSE